MIDLILHDFLDDRLKEIKSDPSVLNYIFDGYTLEKIDQIKEFLLQNDIRTVYHHPRDAADLPCYAVVLESSSESEQVIGMSGDLHSEILISNMEDGWIGSDSDILRENVFLPIDVKQYYSSLYTKDGRRSCRLYGVKDRSSGKGIYIDFENSVLEGGYVSLVGMNSMVVWMNSNRNGSFLQFGFGEKAHDEYIFPVTITNKGIWERVSVDIRRAPSRAKDMIRYMSFSITNDSSATDIYIDSLKGEKESSDIWDEAWFDHVYRIESWSNNAELSLYLYKICQFNMLRFRKYLEESWGLMRQRVSGGDLMPQPDWYPEFAYVRALTYNSTTLEVVPRETDLSTLDVKVGNIDYA